MKEDAGTVLPFDPDDNDLPNERPIHGPSYWQDRLDLGLELKIPRIIIPPGEQALVRLLPSRYQNDEGIPASFIRIARHYWHGGFSVICCKNTSKFVGGGGPCPLCEAGMDVSLSFHFQAVQLERQGNPVPSLYQRAAELRLNSLAFNRLRDCRDHFDPKRIDIILARNAFNALEIVEIPSPSLCDINPNITAWLEVLPLVIMPDERKLALVLESVKAVENREPKAGRVKRLMEILGSDAVLAPVAFGSKEWNFWGWTRTNPESMKNADHLRRLDECNIALLNGHGGLCSIDVDTTEGLQDMVQLNPKLATGFVRRGQRGGLFVFRVRGEFEGCVREVVEKDSGNHWGELRCAQSSLLSGIHPSGCEYSDNGHPVVEISMNELVWPDHVEIKTSSKKSKIDPSLEEGDGRCLLDFGKLKGLRKVPDGWIAQCPACADSKHDNKGNHLKIFPSGRFCCVVNAGDTDHNWAIIKLARDARPYYPQERGTDLVHEDSEDRDTPGGSGTPEVRLNRKTTAKRGAPVQGAEAGQSSEPGTTAPPTNAASKTRADGSGERISIADYADWLEADLPPVRCVSDEWFIYERGVWHPTTIDLIRPLALNVLLRKASHNSMALEVIRTVEGRRQVRRESLLGCYCFDEHEAVLLNCRNGIVRVTAKTIELLKHCPKKLFTGQISAAYELGAAWPAFYEVLATALPDDADRHAIQWWAGYGLFPSLKHRVALVCFGPSGTAKTTVWEHGIGSVFGNDLLTSLGMSDICDEKGYLVPSLERAALNLGGELDARELADSSRFKLLVGGEALPARNIYGKPFKMRGYTVKVVLLTNHLPKFASGTDAELKRLRFLRFAQVPSTPDPSFQDRVSHESDGIFTHFMLPGLQMVLRGDPPPDGSACSEGARERFAVENDPVKYFVEKCCELAADHSESKERLFGAYTFFCEDNGLGEPSMRVFFKQLYSRFDNIHAYRPRNEGGERGTACKGIRLRQGVEWRATFTYDPDREK